MEGFLFQATIYLAAAVIAVPIASRLGLGSVLGYLAAGILIGPVFGLVGSETKDLQHFAEFGVVMMLFLVGLELEPRSLWAMKSKLLGLGGLQLGLTTALITGAAIALGQPFGMIEIGVKIGRIDVPERPILVAKMVSHQGADMHFDPLNRVHHQKPQAPVEFV